MKVIYFHNLSKFDGIFIIKHIVTNRPDWKVKPLMRNNSLYQFEVQIDKVRIVFRDSLKLLPGSLRSLGESLCPELGKKADIDHSTVCVGNLKERKQEILLYMIQDIYLLGGIMLRAQNIYMDHYNIDITSKITLSALALTIFRMHFYDKDKHPIAVPHRTAEEFIRRAYFGGHTDVYKPHGFDLYYYDVNSLYPYVMKESPMPIGPAIWESNLKKKPLEDLYGFIEAIVVCPFNMKKPYLPYRDNKDLLYYLIGKFHGFYYSEELKYAKSLGYLIYPLRGFLYKKAYGLFEGFVTHMYENRLKARDAGNPGLAFVYKILMNSLYGRFGINPKSTVSEICKTQRYSALLKLETFQNAYPLGNDYWLCTYRTYDDITSTFLNSSGLQNTAVQLSAAITGHARIHMYPFISREDCYYTDTDSVVLSNKLTEEFVSTTLLGKFKLEYKVMEGYFLAGKSYCLILNDDKPDVLVH